MNAIWLQEPASRWLDALPLGNGRIGAMVFGGVPSERLALNHENLWRGKTRFQTTQRKADNLPRIRELLFNRQWRQGSRLCEQSFGDEAAKLEPYQPIGDLTLAFAPRDARCAMRA